MIDATYTLREKPGHVRYRVSAFTVAGHRFELPEPVEVDSLEEFTEQINAQNREGGIRAIYLGPVVEVT